MHPIFRWFAGRPLALAAGLLPLLAWSPAQAACRDVGSGRTACTVMETAAGAIVGAGAGPQDIRARTVLPKVATRLLGWVEYDRYTCVGTSGAWTVTSAPTRGTTSTEIVQRTLTNGECPGVLMPFNFMVYTWKDKTEEIVTDSFEATWNSPNFSQPEHFDITKAHVEVQSFDVSTGNVQLNLVGPTDISGTLTATFKGNPVNSAPQTSAATFGAGAATLLIDRPALRQSKYSSLQVDWNATTPALTGKLKPTTAWAVLGLIRYSQYNVPRESACTGQSGAAFVVDSLATCNFTATTLNNRFMRQVNLNGTGQSVLHGILKAGAATTLGTSCAGRFPPGATVDNSYLQMADVRGACNVPLVANSSLATARGSGISCNRNLQLVEASNSNFGVRVRHDTCPACSGDFGGTEGHIDHFSDAEACSSAGVGDLGNYWTVQSN